MEYSKRSERVWGHRTAHWQATGPDEARRTARHAVAVAGSPVRNEADGNHGQRQTADDGRTLETWEFESGSGASRSLGPRALPIILILGMGEKMLVYR